jgi:hypothetical protein
LNPRPRIRRRKPLRACLHSECRSRLRTEPTSPAAISDLSYRHASEPNVTASPLNDSHCPSRRLTRADCSLVIKQRERSQNSQLRIFHGICEDMEPRHAFFDLIPPSKPSRPQTVDLDLTTPLAFPPNACNFYVDWKNSACKTTKPCLLSAFFARKNGWFDYCQAAEVTFTSRSVHDR